MAAVTLKEVQQNNARDLKSDQGKLNNQDTMVYQMVAGLVEEAGEVAGLLKRQLQQRFSECGSAKWEEELGDVLWYYANLVDTLGLDMETIYLKNKEKLDRRYGRA